MDGTHGCHRIVVNSVSNACNEPLNHLARFCDLQGMITGCRKRRPNKNPDTEGTLLLETCKRKRQPSELLKLQAELSSFGGVLQGIGG